MARLPLHPRVDFGGVDWPAPISEFNVSWLRQSFVPSQRARRDKVIAAVTVATTRMDEARDRFTKAIPKFGDTRANGVRAWSPVHSQMERQARAIADLQITEALREIRNEVETVVRPVLAEMDRSVTAAQSLSERVFDKMSVLARFRGDLTRRDAIALRAQCATLTAGQEGIILHKMAQNALDGGAPEDMMMIYAVLNANLRLDRDARAFSNPELLALVEPPEYAEAKPLLQAILDLRNEAGAAFAELGAPIGQVSLNRIARGLADRKLRAAGVVPNDTEEEAGA